MPHPPELEAIPTAGSLVGRHLIVREIAKGTVGPLYLSRTQDNDSAVDTLARVIPLPAELPPKDDQLIAEAIWDSANVGHDMVLRIADVVAGKGWVTLVHDHCVGSLLGSMHWRAGDLGSAFPPEVAARVALDVLEGLEQSRGLCESNHIPWRPGSIALGSLYLCGDGRTRALDGQVMAAVMRSAHMRALSGTSASVAPEMLDSSWEPDERTDVFAVGAVLWELLTGHEINVDGTAPIANVILSVPNGTRVPQGLVHALHRALELDPAKRQSTLRELAVELVMGAEKVATYEQVIEFASTLLPFESAFQPGVADTNQRPGPVAQVDSTGGNTTTTPAGAASSEAIGPSFTASESATNLVGSDPQQVVRHTPVPSLEQSASRFASPFAPLVAMSPRGDAAPKLDPQLDSATIGKSAVPIATPAPSAEAMARPASAGPSMAVSGPTESELAVESRPKGARLEQISWPDEDPPPLLAAAKSTAGQGDPPKKSNGAKPVGAARDQLETIPGGSGLPGGLEVSTGETVKNLRSSEREPGVSVGPIVEIRPDAATLKQPEPTTKSVRRDSARPTTAGKPTTSATSQGSTRPASVRPKASRVVEAILARELGMVSDAEDDLDSLPRKKSGGLQISMTTLILGFSTTVLAVVLVMILMQHRWTPAPVIAVPGVPPAAQPAERAATPGQGERKEPAADRNQNQPAAPAAGKATDASMPSAGEVRIDRRKRPGRSGTSAASKGTEDEGPIDDPKSAKRPKNYVPNDL
jgi:hypothetical protein